MAESEASHDEQLALKKRARRRLVGAAALALFAAIVLPMVMDHEPRPATQDIQVRIPGQDAPTGIAAKVLPGKPAATPLPPVVEESPAPIESKPTEKPEAKPDGAPARTAPAPAADKPAEKPAAKPAEPVVAKPAEKPAEKLADKAVAAKPAEAASKPAAKAAGTDAKPAEKSADKPAAKAPEAKTAEEVRASNAMAGSNAGAEQWVIQLGAYKEAGNVKLLMSKLKGMGVPAYTEKFDSPQGPRTRVRAGPFPSKDAAEKAKVKVKVIGVDGPVAPK